jgi:hypothetical protein
MPSIDINFLRNLRDDYRNYACFIETGTFEGCTIFKMESLFEKLYTIELSEAYHNSAKNNYRGGKIQFLLGDSSNVLRELLPNISDKCVFFLDGHWSAGHWSSGPTGRGTVDVPLIDEVTHIVNLFENEAIIIIDDYRLFETNFTENWSNIKKSTILSILAPRIKEVYHLESELHSSDRLIIHICSK